MQEYTGLEIAIIGMSGRFPGANDLDAFWNNLKNGVESISFISDEELLSEGEDKESINDPLYIKANAFIKDKEYFDSDFFNYTPHEAQLMDPQMRIFHQCVWEAIEDAGCDLNDNKNKIGLFAGASGNVNWQVYSELINKEGLVDDFSAFQLSNARFLSSKLSYFLNLKGPSIFLDTACSTSLVAIHQACRSLLLADCNVAIAGGVTIRNRSKKGHLYTKGMIHSQDGHCRAFDEKASGTVTGEGAAVIVLKTLKNALKDGDHIYAIVKGSGINNDGNHKVGYTAPSVDGQIEAIMMAHKWAKIEPATIGLIEAHGTATELGDPIEVEALNRAFGSSEIKYCALGSVKTNIGHLDIAAGAAGFIKAALALKNRQIPPSLHFETPNPKINFINTPFYVNTELREWRNEQYPLRVGVSSFGIGGTNAHVILEEAPKQEASTESRDYQLLVFSAKTLTALEKNIEKFHIFLKKNTDEKLSDIAYTLQVGRKGFPYRKMIVCRDKNEAIESLANALGNISPVSDKVRYSTVFMFSGQGSQYINMYSGLYKKEAFFKRIVDDCCHIVKKLTGKDLKSIIFDENKTEGFCELDNTQFTQPSLFIMEYALARLFMNWGVQPSIMIGHSIGEYVAACLSDVFSLEDALSLVVKRGELMQQTPRGSMLSLSISENELEQLLENNVRISIAAVNSSELCVVSGKEEDIYDFKTEIEKRGYKSNIIRTSHAFHSGMMDEILNEFEKEVGKIKLNSPKIPFISNLSGDPVTAHEISQPVYWVNHLRQTVKFSKGVETLLKNKDVQFIEMGPGKVLSTFVRANKLRGKGHKVINLVRPPHENENDLSYLLHGLGEVWLNGIEPQWNSFYKDEVRKKVSLPTYSFDQVKYPVNVDAHKMISDLISENTLIKNPDLSKWYYKPSWKLSPLVINKLDVKTRENILIFIDKTGISDLLISRFKENGDNYCTVRIGQCFNEISPQQYEINPSQNEEYDELFRRLSEQSFFPDCIVHAWGVTDGEEESLSEETLSKYLYSLPAIIQSNIRQEGGFSNKRIVLLTSDIHHILDNEKVVLAKTLSQGLLKVLSQEYPSVDSSYIDISSSEEPCKGYVDDLYNEVKDKRRGKVISLRHGRRWEKIYDEIQIDDQRASHYLRENGVYLITGGLGKFGSTLVGQLVKSFKAKVVLVGRTPLPKPEEWNEYLRNEQADEDIKLKIIKLQELEKEGGQVVYLEANVADFQQMSAVVKISEERFGPINGVIHAAGITVKDNFKTINELTKEDFKEQFESKILGLQVLKDVFGKKEMDFCFVTSSLSSVLGGIKFSAYVAANTFIDYYIKSCQEKGELKNWVSANLDSLNFIGTASNAINSEEIFEVFQQVLSFRNIPQIIVSISDLHQRLDKWIYENFLSEKEGLIEANLAFLNEEDIRLGYGPLNSTERLLLQLWERFFGKSEIDLDDDFFEIGGDSLKALTMIGRMHKMFNIEVSITEFFKRSSIRKLSEYITSTKQRIDASGLTIVNDYLSIPNAASKEFYKLSSTQRRQYFLYEFDKLSLSYNQVQFIKLEGRIDHQNLIRAFEKLIERHEILRSSFGTIQEELVQKIEEHVSFKIEYFKSNEENVLLIIEDFIRPFDLAFPPLIRVGLIEFAPNVHVLMVDMHHIVTDGISQNILINDFMSFYMHKELPPLSLQYKDYAEWQQSETQQKKMTQQRDFWLNEFPEEPTILELPINFPRPTIKSYQGKVLSFDISIEETSKLKLIAEKEGVTMFMVVLSIYNILLSKLANQEDIVIGTPASGRQHPDLENILGMFVNMLPLRNYPKGHLTFTDFLSAVKAKTLACFDNQAYPYEALIDELKINRNTSRNPLFETVFSYENFGNAKLEIPGMVLSPYDYDRPYSKFDIMLMAIDAGDKFSFHFEYSTALFKQGTVHQIIKAFKQIIAQIVSNPRIVLSEIEIVNKFEKDLLLKEFNNTHVNYPKKKTVVDIFEEQVQQFPESIAVEYNGIGITYGELNERSNQLSHFLIREGVKPNVIVALLIDRSIEMVISMISILKAGGAYLPIDIESPIERTKLLIADCRAIMLLTTKDLKEKSNEDIPKIFVDDFSYILYDKTNPLVAKPVNSLCYVIYTSGTTGKPKGVMVNHENLMSLFLNDDFYFDFNSNDIWTMFHRYCFDFSVWEMYGALLFGGKLIIISKQDSLDPSSFLEILKEKNVTILNQTPTAFNNLIQQEMLDDVPLLKLRYVIFGGEALNPKILNKWKRRYPEVKLVNMFGITETTIHVTYKEVEQEDILSNTSNIGQPLPTLSTYVLDAHLNVVPSGFIGELYVGGRGVTRGYINDVELTHERFLEHNPNQKGDRIYKSGDLVRINENGDLEYKGRIDDQIQLKGFRIELGEIENALTKYRFIKEAKVVYKERNSEAFLVAYYVADREIENSHLRRVLSESLPSYMLPSYFVKIEQIPLTVNGKADIRMLPEPEVNVNGTYVAATTKNEITLTEIWLKVLSVSQIGVQDNFFAMGGDSIMAIRLINKINNYFDSNLKIIDLYNNQTIKELSSFIASIGLANGKVDYDEVRRELQVFHNDYIKNKPDNNIEVVYPMSNIEKGMCYIQMKHPDEVLYYEQIVWPIYYENFNIDLVRKAVGLLTQKHSALRTAFDLSSFAHIIYKEIDIEIPFVDISNLTEVEQEAVIESDMEASRSIYLKLDAPLWKMSAYKLAANVHILIFDNHHAISDGWTIATFTNELNTLYNELIVDHQFTPEILKSSYKDFITQEILYEKNAENISYWKSELQGFKKFTFGINNNSKVYKTLNKPIDENLYQKIEKLALHRNSSVKNIFFAAYIHTLKIMNFTNDIVVGLVTFNRSIGEDGDKVFGNFLNTIPVRVKVDKSLSSKEFLDVIDKKLLEVKRYDRSSLFSINKALGAQEYGENPITDTLFNYTNFHSSYELRLEDVRNESQRFKVGNYIKGNSLFDVNINGDIDELFISYAYVLSFIDDFLVDKFHNIYLNTLNFFTESYTSELKTESIIEKDELTKLLHTFNDTSTEFPADKTIVDLFRDAASKFSDHDAVVFGEEKLSYFELDEQSTKLANYISNRGIKRNAIVGISVERSFDMVIGILGILKANCAYLPIDPNIPRIRNRYILQDTNVELLLSQKKFSANIGELVDVVYFEDLDLLSERDKNDFNYKSDPNGLAYVIYTSGSTGRPKGVAIDHKAVVNRLNWMQESYPIDQGDVILQKTPFTFDVSVWELFWWAFQGGKLVMLKPNAEKEPEQLIHAIEINQITVIHFVPSMLNILLNHVKMSPNDVYRFKSLRYVFASGEPLMPGHANIFNELFSSLGIKLVNLYGPTEATVDVTYFNCDAQNELLQVPIGKPINNIKIYVLDADLNLLPIGITGELYIAGVGVGRGYINQVDLTTERFIVNPFNTAETLYKTGDMARWLTDGNIEYIGRADDQVKIRGNRVELGEIQQVLLNIRDIDDCVVVSNEVKMETKIIAFYTSKQSLSSLQLKGLLRKTLPEYMIPYKLIQIQQIPLMANGKANRKELVELCSVDLEYVKSVEEPSSKIEKEIAKIWIDEIGVEKISIDDIFFDIGGHSLSAIKTASKMKNKYGIEPNFADFFNQTFSQFVNNYEVKLKEFGPMVNEQDL